MGYNPYRDERGRFAKKDGTNNSAESLTKDNYNTALSNRDRAEVAAIRDYAMDSLANTAFGQEILESEYRDNRIEPKMVTAAKNILSDNESVAHKARESFAKMHDFDFFNHTSATQIKESLSEQLNSADNPNDPRLDDVRTQLACVQAYINNATVVEVDTSTTVATVSEPDGGASFNPFTNRAPVSGFCYSPYPEHSKVIEFSDNAVDNIKMLTNYAAERKDLLMESGHYVGLWNDPATGKIYLDISVNTMDATEARKECENNDQIAFFDFQTFESVTVNSEATSGQ